jgi:hypothetical protein
LFQYAAAPIKLKQTIYVGKRTSIQFTSPRRAFIHELTFAGVGVKKERVDSSM